MLLFLQYAAALEQFSDSSSPDTAADTLANVQRIFSLADKPTDFVYTRVVAVPFNSQTSAGTLTENAFFKISGRLKEIDPTSSDLTRYSDRAFELLNGTVEWRFQEDSNDADPKCTRSITVSGNGKDFISNLDVVVDVNDGKDANGNVAHLNGYDLRLTYKKQGLSGKPEFALAGQILIPVDVTYITTVHQSATGVRQVCDGSTESTTDTRKKSIPVQFPVTLLDFDTSKFSQSGELTANEPYGNEFEGKVTSISGAQEAKFTTFVTTTPVKILGNDGPWKVTWNIELPNAMKKLEEAIEQDSDNDGLTDVDETRYGTNSNNPDTDGDGLLDGWEVNGVYKNGNKVVDLPAMGSDPLKRDLFLEIDWMAANASHSHKPENAAIQRVVNAFANKEIRLHVDVGQWGGGNQVREQPNAAWSEFKFINPDEKPNYLANGNKYLFDIKKANFDKNRIGIFHWGIFVHQRNDSSGQAEVGGNFFVALPVNDTIAAQSGTLMHEFGHTLQLGHGGRQDKELQYDNTHFKPNYRSVMNYHFQFNGVPYFNISTGKLNYKLDYSNEDLSDLDESTGLNEAQGLRSTEQQAASYYSCFDTGHGIAPDVMYVSTKNNKNMIVWFVLNNSPVDWDCDGRIGGSPTVSVNGYYDDPFNNTGPLDLLEGRKDWNKIVLQIGCPGYGIEDNLTENNLVRLGNMQGNCTELSDIRANLGLASAESEQLPPRYPFLGEACDGQDNDGNGRIDEGCSDRDSDGVVDDLDNCPAVANPNQLDSNHDFIGDACTETIRVATQSGASSTLPNSTSISGSNLTIPYSPLSQENPSGLLSFLSGFPFEILGLIIVIVIIVGVLVVAGIAYLLLKK